MSNFQNPKVPLPGGASAARTSKLVISRQNVPVDVLCRDGAEGSGIVPVFASFSRTHVRRGQRKMAA